VKGSVLRERPGARELDLLGIGQCSIDHVCTVEGLPPIGGKEAMLAYEVLPGGQVATALLAGARLGLRGAFVGSAGTDADAGVVLAPLAAAGIDLTGVRRVPGAATRLATILVDRGSGERTVLWYRDPRLRLQPEDIPRERFARTRCVLLDGDDPDVAAYAATLARDAGVPVVLDVDALGAGIERLLSLADFPVVSRAVAEALGGAQGVRGGLARLAAGGARMPVVTLGDHGCLARLGEREFAVPGFAIRPRDTTGAGDVFHAAFIWGLLEGLEPEPLLRAANAAAALSCRALGAQGGLPTRAELGAFLRDHEPGPWREPAPR
jgi:sugar/nucleoside kinase (ribokinase family)